MVQMVVHQDGGVLCDPPVLICVGFVNRISHGYLLCLWFYFELNNEVSPTEGNTSRQGSLSLTLALSEVKRIRQPSVVKMFHLQPHRAPRGQ